MLWSSACTPGRPLRPGFVIGIPYRVAGRTHPHLLSKRQADAMRRSTQLPIEPPGEPTGLHLPALATQPGRTGENQAGPAVENPPTLPPSSPPRNSPYRESMEAISGGWVGGPRSGLPGQLSVLSARSAGAAHPVPAEAPEAAVHHRRRREHPREHRPLRRRGRRRGGHRGLRHRGHVEPAGGAGGGRPQDAAGHAAGDREPLPPRAADLRRQQHRPQLRAGQALRGGHGPVGPSLRLPPDVHVRGGRLGGRVAELPAVGHVGLGAELRLPHRLGAPLPEAGRALRGGGRASTPLVTEAPAHQNPNPNVPGGCFADQVPPTPRAILCWRVRSGEQKSRVLSGSALLLGSISETQEEAGRISHYLFFFLFNFWDTLYSKAWSPR